MKYKHTRKESWDTLTKFIRINTSTGRYAIDSDDWFKCKKIFLAQKEDRKEEQPCNNFKPASNDEGYETTKYPHQCPICKGWRGFCLNCNKDHHENGWDSCNPTPSPLEIEEIDEITGVYRDIGGGVSYTQKNKKEDDNLSVLINSLISNQKKLYQYIKEKK